MGSKVEKHLSRLAMPKSWHIKRKGIKWVTRPKPGAHPLKLGMPLNLIFRDLLGYAKTTKEVKQLLSNQEVLIDGKRRKDTRFLVGIMDTISIPKIKKFLRVILSKKGKITLFEISESESKIKLCKIKGKSQVNKKIQLNLYDGKNILLDKGDYKVGDSVVIELPSHKIKDVVKLEKGSLVYLLGGKHISDIGVIEEVKGNKIVYKRGNDSVETSKKYAFVIGKGKSVITFPEK